MASQNLLGLNRIDNTVSCDLIFLFLHLILNNVAMRYIYLFLIPPTLKGLTQKMKLQSHMRAPCSHMRLQAMCFPPISPLLLILSGVETFPGTHTSVVLCCPLDRQIYVSGNSFFCACNAGEERTEQLLRHHLCALNTSIKSQMAIMCLKPTPLRTVP